MTWLAGDEIAEHVAQLLDAARSEVLFLLAGPARPEDDDDRLITATLGAAARGVAIISAWAPDLLATYAPRVGEHLRGAGWIRASADLPMRVLVVDGHTVVLPVDADDLAQGAVSIRTPALRHLATDLIEQIYANATPLPAEQTRLPTE